MKLRTPLVVLALLSAFLALPTATGCTEKRKAAAANIAADEGRCLAKCAADKLEVPTEEVIKQCAVQCAVTVTGDDLRNYTDLIFGMKAGAAKAGAKLPDAPDGGAHAR